MLLTCLCKCCSELSKCNHVHANVTCVYIAVKHVPYHAWMQAKQSACCHVTCVTCHADYVRPGTQGPLHAKACHSTCRLISDADYVIGPCSTEHLMTKKFVRKDLKASPTRKVLKDLKMIKHIQHGEEV